MRFALTLGCLLALGCGSAPAAAPQTPAPEAAEVPSFDSLKAVLAGPHRSDAHRARDAHRHPAETLAFFGVQPSDTVLEVWPGGGWYTEVLAPYLREEGTLIAGGYDASDEGFLGDIQRRYLENLSGHAALYSEVQHELFTRGSQLENVADDSVDSALVFRAVHNMVRGEGSPESIFETMARVLRPGGVLGIVQHRLPEELVGDGEDQRLNDGQAGYLSEGFVIGLANAAGFVLDGCSDVNANPADTHLHPDNVWSMPPSWRGEDPALQNLGESDRMTLRFRYAPDAEARPTSCGEL